MKNLSLKFEDWKQASLKISIGSLQHDIIKPGAIYWCSIGQNIGREENGKGSLFTRPVLIVKKFDTHLVLVLPLSSQPKIASYYPRVIVAGRTDFILFNQIRTIDTLRIGDFIDELDEQTFLQVRHKLAQFLNL